MIHSVPACLSLLASWPELTDRCRVFWMPCTSWVLAPAIVDMTTWGLRPLATLQCIHM